MIKRLQIGLSDEAWQVVEAINKEASENFEAGSINYSDVINEMILNSKIDIKVLQLKHTDVRRSLRVMAAKEDLDIDSIIKSLNEIKNRTKRGAKQLTLGGEVEG